jgi:hypothetical protein
MNYAAVPIGVAVLIAVVILVAGCGPKPVAYSTPATPAAQPPMPPPGAPGGQAPQAQMPAMPPQ